MHKNKSVVIGERQLSLDEIISVAVGRAKVEISKEKSFKDRIDNSRKKLHSALISGVPVYGVTTGYGKSCGKRMALDAALKNGDNLVRFHGCGTGEPVGIEETRAAMVSRLCCFARGYSGVSMDLLYAIAEFLNREITPVVPSEGSVGASGDLTPMSYITAALFGEREVIYKDKRMPSMEALGAEGISPYKFGPKEPLAIMNGTSIMTGISVIALMHAKHLLNSLVAASALSIHSLMGNDHHYHKTISEAKMHPGQSKIASLIASLLKAKSGKNLSADALETLQDPYSIRCSPQILGVLDDTIVWASEWIRIEANSANDNPIIDPSTGEVLMGGNFYGGHVALAMDALKTAMASAADMSDRQIAMMVDPHVNRGLPADLVRAADGERLFNHGFKAMSIASSSLTAEALKLTMPATSFSRSTESHNQDKVSMGTMASKDAKAVSVLASKVAAIHLLTAAQACEIRDTIAMRPALAEILKSVRDIAPATYEDRPMDRDVQAVADAVLSGRFSVEIN